MSGRVIGRAIAVGCAVGLVAAAVPGATAEAAAPQTRLILGGTEYEVAEWLPGLAALPVVTRYVTPNRQIGAGFFPGTAPVLIDYPASWFRPGTANQRIAIGADRLGDAIRQRPEPLAVVGQSQGTVVLDRVRARLGSDPNAPAAEQLQFVLFNSPTRGLASTLFRPGTRIPIVDITVGPAAESRYDTALVIHEYDVWGDFPDRPWRPLTLLNALATMAFIHQLTDDVPAQIAPTNITTAVNSLGGTDTSYFVPTPTLPITEVLRVAGVPDKAVDALDAVIRPVIDAGYSRNDKPGDPRPYLDRGVLTTRAGAARAAAATAHRADSEEGRKPQTRTAQRPRRG
ncbi:MAG: PE-PPE domain-containing protein [Mycobacterium sp.]|nr:PE-PPE domain-containing protein [Mycobacterium sp.]